MIEKARTKLAHELKHTSKSFQRGSLTDLSNVLACNIEQQIEATSAEGLRRDVLYLTVTERLLDTW